jgi:LuxR family maltose regulon positive regulatory protein
LLEGDPDAADPVFAHAFDAAMRMGALPFAATILAERATIAIDRDDWNEAGAFSDHAYQMVRESGTDDYWTSALVYAVAARVALHRGDITVAREDAARAARLRPLLTYALPVLSVQALCELAQVYIGLADTAGSREVLRQARDILQQRPNLGLLPQKVAELRERLDTRAVAPLASHREDTGHLDLPKAGCVVAERGDRPDARDRSPRRIGALAIFDRGIDVVAQRHGQSA